ncbi:MAG: hypothetical protein IID45_09900 [Planctomycetes bacterium]|nr:hypothetical protein [Planctomycetota bacterium]
MKRFWILSSGALLIVTGFVTGCCAHRGGCPGGGFPPAQDGFQSGGVPYESGTQNGAPGPGLDSYPSQPGSGSFGSGGR